MKGIRIRSYVIGFGLSLVLTLSSYFVVKHHLDTGHLSPSHSAGRGAVMILAISQLLVQLYFFLHVRRNRASAWNAAAMAFAAVIVVILVAGSLWIMTNLDYHHAHNDLPNHSDSEIIKDEGVGP